MIEPSSKQRNVALTCLLMFSFVSQSLADGEESQAEFAAASFASFAARVEASRDAGPTDERVTRLRDEIHQFLRTNAGRAHLEPTLELLLRLPARGGPPPAAPRFPFDAGQAATYQDDYARWTGLPLEVTNRAGMTLRLIPPGMFLMGSPANEPGHGERPWDETQHPVWLTRPFYLSKHETTVAQFRQFVDERNYVTDGEKNGGGHAHDERAVWEHRPGASWREPGYAGPFHLQDEHPVVHVSHTDAKLYCGWLNSAHAKPSDATYDLPTESQWEWACRAGSGTRFWWGANEDQTGKVLNAGDRTLKEVQPRWPRAIMPMQDGHAFPAPVGSFRANAFGLHDMLGNVWEFCSTRYGPYPRELDVDPADLDPQRGFAVRGGGWSNEALDERCATRNADPPHFCHSNLGFRVCLQLPPRNVSRVIAKDKMPARVHVVESYETDIEKRWWMSGEVEEKVVPPSLSKSVPNRRACRATPTLNFDRKMGDQTKRLKGVIFNPVPGPPMGQRTRLAFRYYLEGTDSIKVQIYSLTNNYHRYLLLTDLPQGQWQTATVDMTQARRPDGSGGPLARDERIDDIQFYIAPDADLIIDDIVLYEAADENETRHFPRRVIFTGWFDTGKQGQEWPGDFEIVLHDKPLTWDAAKSVVNPASGVPWIRVGLRGRRQLSRETSVCFRYRIEGGDTIQVAIVDSKTSTEFIDSLTALKAGQWSAATLRFTLPAKEASAPLMADEIRFLVEKNAELFIDDVLLFEAGGE